MDASRTFDAHQRDSKQRFRELDSTSFELSQRIARLQGSIAAGTRWEGRKQQQFDIEAVPQDQYDLLKAAGLNDREIIVYYRTQQALGGKNITTTAAATPTTEEGVGAEEGGG